MESGSTATSQNENCDFPSKTLNPGNGVVFCFVKKNICKKYLILPLYCYTHRRYHIMLVMHTLFFGVKFCKRATS